MSEQFVIFNGKKIFVSKSNTLDLSGQEIEEISEIEGLETIKDLRELNLENNQIYQIEGLDHFSNLKVLKLEKNEIESLYGLDKLFDLQELYVAHNDISQIESLEILRYFRDLRKLSLHSNNFWKTQDPGWRINEINKFLIALARKLHENVKPVIWSLIQPEGFKDYTNTLYFSYPICIKCGADMPAYLGDDKIKCMECGWEKDMSY